MKKDVKSKKPDRPVFDWHDVRKRGLENVVDLTDAEKKEWREKAARYRFVSIALWPVYQLLAITAVVVSYAYLSGWIQSIEIGALETDLMRWSTMATLTMLALFFLASTSENCVAMLSGKMAAEETFYAAHDRMSAAYIVEELDAEEIEAKPVAQQEAEALLKKLEHITVQLTTAKMEGREADAAFWRRAMDAVSDEEKAKTKARMDARRKAEHPELFD